MKLAGQALLSRVLPALALVLLVCWGWLTGIGRAPADMLVPSSYGGDGWAVIAQMKAYQAGELLPFLSKDIASLGAPFGANWTDYPAEDLIYLAGGLLGKLVGIGASAALLPMLFAVLAGVSFYVTAQVLGYRREAAFTCAVLFALAPFAFMRSLPHLTLMAYAHVPLLLLGVHWVMRPDARVAPPVERRLAIAGAVLAGLLNPYYLGAYLFLLTLAGVGAWAASQRANWTAAAMLFGIAAGVFFLQMLDTIWMTLAHGGNAQAVVRNFQGLDIYGMRLPDMIFPVIHRLAAWEALARSYHEAAPMGLGRGEAATSYLGICGVLALFWLLAKGTVSIAARQFERVSSWYWMALATLALGIVGGVNYLLGSLGFVMLRASNRFSIILLAIALFWLCERLTHAWRGVRWIACALLLAVGLWDQLPPPRFTMTTGTVRAAIEGDRRFVQALEAAVPAGTMVFQLPVKGFPETGPIFGMQDYEQLRPYFYSKTLRFSFGSMKGRGTALWQGPVAELPPAQMVTRLATLGFGVLYVNLHGFSDLGAAIRPQLEALLGKPIAENKELVAFRLPPPVGEVELPRLMPIIDYKGFWPAEARDGLTWAWASRRKGTIDVRTPYVAGGFAPSEYYVNFGVDSGFGGAVLVRLDGVEQAVIPNGTSRAFALRLPREARHWRIEIEAEHPPRLPGNTDRRLLGFRLVHLYLSEGSPPIRAERR